MANQLTPRKAFENPDLELFQSDRFEGQYFERKEAPTREQASKERGKPDRKLKEKLDRLREKLQRTIGSFAVSNEEPSGGLFVLGINDRGDIRGLSHLSSDQLQSLLVTDSLLEGVNVSSKRLDCTDCRGDANFIYLFYVPYTEKSVACSADSKHRVWKRVDSHTIELPPEAIEQLKQDRGIIAFESLCFCEFSEEEIDHQLAERFRLATIGPYDLAPDCPLEDVLFHAGAIARKEGKLFWTRAGFLFLAKNPRRLLAGAYIRLVKFEGVKSTASVSFSPTFDRDFSGPLPHQISRTREFMRDAAYLNAYEYRKNGSLFREPELPSEAWNEAIVNAVVHRSYGMEDQPILVIKYSDKLVVESPGPFVQPMPKSEFRISEVPAGRSRPRNPRLMSWFRLLEDENGERYVKQWQEGIKTIETAMKAAGKPEPTYKTNSEVALSLETNGLAIEARIAADQPCLNGLQVSAGPSPLPVSATPEQGAEMPVPLQGKIASILRGKPPFCRALAEQLGVVNAPENLAQSLVERGFAAVWHDLAGDLQQLRDHFDELRRVLFWLAQGAVRIDKVAEVREQMKSQQAINVFSLQTRYALMAELVLRSAMETEFLIAPGASDGHAPVVGRHTINLHETGIDRAKAREKVQVELEKRFKDIGTGAASQSERVARLKGRLKAYFLSKDPFLLVHDFQDPVNFPYLVEFMLPPPDQQVPLDSVTVMDEDTLYELIRIILIQTGERQ